MRSMIINADDFGLNAAVNRAILDAFRQQLCSSTTLMANMPGFEEACELAHERKLTDRVGLHLNLAEGFPLTDAIKRSSRFCDPEGCLKLTSRPLTLFLNAEAKKLLSDEVRAQIARCRQMGVPLTHLDSHHHLHIQWAILGVLLPVARQERIPYVRIPRNCGSGIGPLKETYKWLVVRQIAAAKMRRTEYFGSIADYLWLKHSGERRGSIEIMVHPRYLSSGLLCDHPSKTSLLEQVQRVGSYTSAFPFREIKMPVFTQKWVVERK